MKVCEVNNIGCKGRIKAEFVNNDGLVYPLVARNNVITYSGADIMARLLGNDTTYVPRHIGFMYGASATATTLVDPDLLPDTIKRVHPWTTVTADATAAVANVLISPLILNTGFAAESSTYTGNVITVAAFTGTSLEYAFPITGGIFAPALQDGFYFYQALLLNRRQVGANIVYTPFSRVTLRNSGGTYDAKPVGFQLSLYWTISFD